MQLWTGPGQAITASSVALSLEPLALTKYAPYRTQLTEFEIKHSKVAIEMVIAENLAEAESRLMDDFVRDLILVDSLLTRIGRKSCTFKERMLHVDTKEVHATYETTEVFFDPQTRKSTEIPASIRQALKNA